MLDKSGIAKKEKWRLKAQNSVPGIRLRNILMHFYSLGLPLLFLVERTYIF
jgi:hypothetical protein